ncbi:MAG: winged helix-turn-helix transcriptional regulator, partial [Firmicutes bacterium]|nr:winged helix-turn-helix transcriptional regulator [Bacillota bacterium]
MIPAEQKIERMITVAHMYYENDMTQSQIAKALGISRPLVSVLLTEAKSCGIVKITINDISVNQEKMAKQLKERFLLKHV